MTRRLVLLCHGMTPALRAAAFPTDEALEAPAADLARAMAPRLPRAEGVRCAPERRTRETALSAALAVDVDAELRDWDCGRWRGRAFERVLAEEPEGISAWRADPLATPHGGESLVGLIARAAGWLAGLKETRVLAITHPAVVRAMVVSALGLPVEAFWRLDVLPLSLTELRGGPVWNLRAFSASAGAEPVAGE